LECGAVAVLSGGRCGQKSSDSFFLAQWPGLNFGDDWNCRHAPSIVNRYAKDAGKKTVGRGLEARLLIALAALFFLYVGLETVLGWIASYAKRPADFGSALDS